MAKASVAGSRFTWSFERNGSLVEANASGEAAGHHFSGSTSLVHVGSAEDQSLADAVRGLEARMSAIADRFHRASPWPYILRSQEDGMNYRQLVDEALAQYKGVSLQGLSLGPAEWVGFLAETKLTPDQFGNVIWRGVPITAGISGIKYIVGQ